MPEFPRAAEGVEALAEVLRDVAADLELPRRVSEALGEADAPLAQRAARRQLIEDALRAYRAQVARRDRIKEELAAANAEKDAALDRLRECVRTELERIKRECADERVPRDVAGEVLRTIEEGKVDPSDRAPSDPLELTAVPKGHGEVELAWKKPPRTRGGRVANFVIETRRGDGEWAMLQVAYASPLTLTGLAAGRCEYRVRAQNRAGLSASGPSVEVWIP